MKIGSICRMLLLLAAVSFSAGAFAQDQNFSSSKPRWVKKGEKGIKSLNDHRLNDTYRFKMFHLENADEGVIWIDRFAPLVEYIYNKEGYGVPQGAMMVLDSIADPSNGRMTYTLTFANPAGDPQTVYAQLIDQYTELDDFVTNHFEYNHYQLFAISEPGVINPQFDEFTVTNHFNRAKATAMSLFPGLGQIYKGQNVKGWIFMATDIALVGTLIYSVDRYKFYKNKRKETGIQNYHNNVQTFREFMVFSAIAAGGLYVYNLFDAALCHIPNRVEISRPQGGYNAELSITPTFAPDFTGNLNVGLGLTLSF